MKYKINYILSGGSTSPESTPTSSEDLPIAFSIYEFKSSIGLVPKGIDQNNKNVKRCKSGAFKEGDKSETFKFKTNDSTKKVIFINDKNNTEFNNLFMESKDVHRSMDDLIANKKIEALKKLINRHLESCFVICDDKQYNIYVLDSDNEIRPISDSLLWGKFIEYRHKFNQLNADNIRQFLLDNLKKDPEKDRYIKNFPLVQDLEREITADKFSDLKTLADEVEVNFRYKKLYPYITLKERKERWELKHRKKDKLNETQLEILENITKELNKIKADDGRSILEIYDILDTIKKNSGAIGNKVGNEFETLIEETDDLRENLIRIVDKKEPGDYKTYFNYTWGSSDIDMTVVLH